MVPPDRPDGRSPHPMVKGSHSKGEREPGPFSEGHGSEGVADDEFGRHQQQGMLLALTSVAVALLIMILCLGLWHVSRTSARASPLSPAAHRSLAASLDVDDYDDFIVESKARSGLRRSAL